MRYIKFSIFSMATIFILLNYCSEPPAHSTIGSARLSITLRNVGELSKSNSIELQSLYVEMSKGANILRDTIPLNGNSEVLLTQNYVDLSEGDWSLQVESRDGNAEIIHADSAEFTVIADQVVEVNLSLVSKYSMLVANFLGIANNIYRCELLVDGVNVSDSSFDVQDEIDFNISLEYDYLTTDIEHTIKLDAYGEYEGVEYLFYSADTNINVIAGEDQTYELQLAWVGPYGGLTGDTSIEIIVGATGSTTMNGNFPPPTNIVTDIDGNQYYTIFIGNHYWMAENLKVTKYRNGDAIPLVTEATAWIELTTGAYCNYGNDDANIDTYGSLYNGYVIEDARNIAPEGWHIPTDDEWKSLEMALGMSQSEADVDGWRGTNEGSKLAGHADLWNDGALKEDSEFGVSRFNILPGGLRSWEWGDYSHIGTSGSFWSSSESPVTNLWSRQVNYSSTTILHTGSYKHNGFAIRCVKD